MTRRHGARPQHRDGGAAARQRTQRRRSAPAWSSSRCIADVEVSSPSTSFPTFPSHATRRALFQAYSCPPRVGADTSLPRLVTGGRWTPAPLTREAAGRVPGVAAGGTTSGRRWRSPGRRTAVEARARGELPRANAASRAASARSAAPPGSCARLLPRQLPCPTSLAALCRRRPAPRVCVCVQCVGAEKSRYIEQCHVTETCQNEKFDSWAMIHNSRLDIHAIKT